MSPHFGDARVLLSGAESYALGFDPLVSNPSDPWGRPMNYPRVWQLLGQWGLNQSHTTVIGLMFIGAFLVGVYLLSDGIGLFAACLMAACILSPSVMFGIERANNDLLMFFLLALAVRIYKPHHHFALVCIVCSGILKLFPVFGFVILLREEPRTCLRRAASYGTIMLAYLATTFRDLLLIREATPQSTRVAYGINIFWMSVRDHFSSPLAIGIAKLASGLAIVAICLLCFRVRGLDPISRDRARGQLDTFRVGCAVYIGSFLLTSNWDYRLMFLLFTVPCLCQWSRDNEHMAGWLARVALPAILLACWSLGLRALMLKCGFPMAIWFLLDQTAKWTVLAALSLVFALTLPDWICRRKDVEVVNDQVCRAV